MQSALSSAGEKPDRRDDAAEHQQVGECRHQELLRTLVHSLLHLDFTEAQRRAHVPVPPIAATAARAPRIVLPVWLRGLSTRFFSAPFQSAGSATFAPAMLERKHPSPRLANSNQTRGLTSADRSAADRQLGRQRRKVPELRRPSGGKARDDASQMRSPWPKKIECQTLRRPMFHLPVPPLGSAAY